jgi:chromosome condensin MukBEF MukE localization factor
MKNIKSEKSIYNKILPIPEGYKLVRIVNNVATLIKEDYVLSNEKVRK